MTQSSNTILVNFRDVGGLPADSGVTRSGVLYRGASPYFMGPAQVKRLVEEYGVRTRVDVRSPAEIDEATNPSLAAIPLTRELQLHSGGRGWPPDTTVRLPAHQIVADHYAHYLLHSGESFATLTRLMIHEAPVLLHCTAGKDRTGTAVAVLLDAVGVDRDAIIGDYARTADHLDELIDHLYALPAYRARLEKLPQEALSSWPETMATFLDHLRKEYGGGRGYLTAQGLSEDELDDLTRSLVAADGGSVT